MFNEKYSWFGTHLLQRVCTRARFNCIAFHIRCTHVNKVSNVYTHVKFSSICCAISTWGVSSLNKQIFTEDKRNASQNSLQCKCYPQKTKYISMYIQIHIEQASSMSIWHTSLTTVELKAQLSIDSLGGRK